MREEANLIPKRRFREFQNTKPWEQWKVRDLADIVRGASPRPIQDSKWFDVKSDVGWLRIADVTEQNGRIHYLEQRISNAGQEKTRVLTEPHLLLSIAATVGKPVVNYVKTGVHDGFLIFQNPKFEREFMFQWLEMFRPKWQKYGQPGSQVNLNSDLVKAQDIPLPSKEEQMKIGNFFAQLEDNITLQQSKLEKTKALKSAYLSEMFPAEGELVPKRRFSGFTQDWVQRRMEDLAEVSTGRAFSSKDFSAKGEYLVVTNKNIQDEERRIVSSGDRINILDDKIVKKYILSGKNILVTMDGVNIGKTGRYSNEKAVLAQRVGRLRSDQHDFIYQVTSNNKFITEMNRISVGNAIKHISLSQISNYSFMAPVCTDEQFKIGNFFKQLDDIITHHQSKLEKLQNLKKAYLHEMFV